MVIENPKILVTKRGPLLISGCWGVVRKPSAPSRFFSVPRSARLTRPIDYISDWIQALCWGLSTGFGSKITYFYPVFHIIMLLHRNSRDNARYVLPPSFLSSRRPWLTFPPSLPFFFAAVRGNTGPIGSSTSASYHIREPLPRRCRSRNADTCGSSPTDSSRMYFKEKEAPSSFPSLPPPLYSNKQEEKHKSKMAFNILVPTPSAFSLAPVCPPPGWLFPSEFYDIL